MKVSTVLANLNTLTNTPLEIECVFIMKKDIGYIVESEADRDNRTVAIEIAVPNLENMLLKKVPAYGGSQYSYCHDAKITGTLTPMGSNEFKYSLNDISSLVFYMHGEEFIAIP
jgi:hypothetical protein